MCAQAVSQAAKQEGVWIQPHPDGGADIVWPPSTTALNRWVWWGAAEALPGDSYP